MQRKLKHVIAGTLLSACVGITYAGETPRILGSIEYQALSQQEMASITGEGGLSGGGVDPAMGWRTNLSVSGGSKPGGSTGDVMLQGVQNGNQGAGGEF